MPDRDAGPGLSAEAGSPFFISPLSERQIEVLGLAALGWTDSEIAQRLYISVHTARAHLQAIRERMGARNTTHAVAMALAAGVIEVDAHSAIEPV